MKSKAKLVALAGILGITGIGGTFAYFSQTQEKTNVFQTGTFDTNIVEVFIPKEGWEPGETVKKEVSIQNRGTFPAVVRVKFSECWVRTEDKKLLYEADSTIQKDPLDPEEEGRARNKLENVYQENVSDGKTGAEVDDSVVEKSLNLSEWVYNREDGYYYYKYVIPGKEKDGTMYETSKILNSIRLTENVDLGRFVEKRYYATRERPDEWVEFATMSEASLEPGRYYTTAEMAELVERQGSEINYLKVRPEITDSDSTGYSEADYTLRIEAETVQATKKAVESIFGSGICEETEKLGCEWIFSEE